MAAAPREVARLYLLAADRSLGVVQYGHWRLPCTIGPSGVLSRKREGDGATPFGLFPIRKVLFRPDRLRRPRTGLPLAALRPDDGWCDETGDRNYNCKVALPYAASAEPLWRADDLYDIVVVLGFNDAPRSQGAGSAIFMHVARPDMGPTSGCLALRQGDLLKLLEAPHPPHWVDTRPAR